MWRAFRLLIGVAIVSGVGCGDDESARAPAASSAELPDIAGAPEVKIDRLGSGLFVVERDAVYGLLVDVFEGDAAIERSSGGLTISDIGLTSFAARLGLKNGDQLQAANRASLARRGALRAALALARKDGELVLEVLRDGRPVAIRYVFEDMLGSELRSRNPSLASLDKHVRGFDEAIAELSEGIASKSDTELDVDRRVLEAIREHKELITWTDVHYQPQVGEGLRIHDTVSVFRELGILPRYDLIKTVGDVDIHSAIEFQQQLALAVDETAFKISVVRLDEPMVLSYKVVTSSALNPDALTAAIEAWKANLPPDSTDDDDLGVATGPRTGVGSSRKPIVLSGITKVSDVVYEIERKTLEAILANPAAAARGARIVPSLDDGKPDGVKLYAIRPHSVYSKLGLMNGDTIRRINGHSITTPDKALEAYVQVRKSKVVHVDLTRRGRPVRMTYRIK